MDEWINERMKKFMLPQKLAIPPHFAPSIFPCHPISIFVHLQISSDAPPLLLPLLFQFTSTLTLHSWPLSLAFHSYSPSHLPFLLLIPAFYLSSLLSSPFPLTPTSSTVYPLQPILPPRSPRGLPPPPSLPHCPSPPFPFLPPLFSLGISRISGFGTILGG